MASNGVKRDSRTVHSLELINGFAQRKNFQASQTRFDFDDSVSGFIQLPKYSSPVTLRFKPGCYPSVDSIMKAITKAALGKKEKKLIETYRSNDSMLSWKIDGVTRRLHVKTNGIVRYEGLNSTAVSEDLKNILDTDVITTQNYISQNYSGSGSSSPNSSPPV